MRVAIFLAFALVMPACDDDAAGGNDASPTSEDLSAEVADLATGGQSGGDGGYSTDAGGVGAGCMTACDCTPGLGCFGGQCVATNNPVYCCGGSPCPSGAFCESSGGMFGRCGVTGPVDLANFDHCPLIDCTNGNGMMRCIKAGCASCVAGGSGMVCSR